MQPAAAQQRAHGAATGATVVTPRRCRRRAVSLLLLLHLVLLQRCCSGRLLNNASPMSATELAAVQRAGAVAGRISIAPSPGRPLAAAAAAAAGAAAAGAAAGASGEATSIGTVSFALHCAACVNNTAAVTIGYQPLWGPGRIGKSGGWVLQGPFRLAAAADGSNSSSSGVGSMSATAVPLFATSVSTFYHHASCEGAAGRISLVASSMTPMGLVDASGQCLLAVPMKRAALARRQGDTAVTLTCPPVVEQQALGTARVSTQQQRRGAAVVAAAGAAAAVSDGYSTFSLKSDCSRCSKLRVAVRYKPVAPVLAPGDAPWVTAGWFTVGAQPQLLLATRDREVAFYADCHNRTTGQTFMWAVDIPWAVADAGCTSGLKLWTVSLWPRRDWVGTLSCDATTPSMSEDLCAHTVCAPSGPCQLNSTCNAADGTCIPQHVAAGKPCLSGRGACTAAHTCDLCAGVVCTPKGPCESNSTCNPADGMCVPEFVAPGQPCLDARGTCNANHTCDACGTSCGPHGSCNSEAGMCVCAPGWGGMACSQELPQDLCQNRTCSFQGSCDPSTGTCLCNSGWGGDACDKEQVGGSVGACASVDCNGRGVCMEDFEGKAVCVCSWGFLGSACELEGYLGGRDLAPLSEEQIAQVRTIEADFQQQLFPPCCGVDCGAHGTCVGNGTCDCDYGWSGPACSLADPCLTRDCSGHGLCQLGGRCSCNHGFYGQDCEIQDPCRGISCSGHGQCFQGACICYEEWTGSSCQILRPGCVISPVCNWRAAICPSGLRRRRLAGSIDSNHTAALSAAATGPGGLSFTCTCESGFEGEACERNLCANLTCVHGGCSCGDGGCDCHCERGWVGTNCDVPDPCEGYSCNNGFCHVAADNTPTCSCLTGWTGAQCQHVDSPVCEPNEACVHGVLCLDTATCACELGWQGTRCDEADPMACQPDSCSGHGTCSYGPHCECDVGWTSADCSKPDPCTNKTCSSHGTCQDDGSCQCASGWGGADCSTLNAGCSTTPCSGRGVMCNGGSVCKCDTGWFGELCTQPDACLSVGCNGHGTCTSGQCICDPGHSGPTCAQHDPCFVNDCSGHGHCVFGTGGQCKCNHGWQPSTSSGTDCASRAPTFSELYDCSAWSALPGAGSSGRRLAATPEMGPTAAAAAAATSTANASGTPELCFTAGKRCFLSAYDATSKVSPARSQGNTTMCTSYAALAVAEAALLAAGNGQELSSKALHFCDAKHARQQPVATGWWLEEAMKVVGKQYGAALGPAQASCYADSPAKMYAPSNVGDMGGQCSRLWARPGCYHGGLSLVDLTPGRPATMPLSWRIYTATMREGMLRQLKALRVKYGDGVSRFADYPVIRPEGDLRINYVHAAAIIGWSFEGAPNQQASKPRFWIIKDSDPQYPWKWKLATEFTNGASAFANGTGNGVYIAGFVA